MSTQDQIDFIYPLTYTVVSGDWILKIADKYAIEGVSREERSQQIIEANADFLLPRSGYNTLDQLLEGKDWILPGDKLIIPPYILPPEESEDIEPELLAEYTLCSDNDGIRIWAQILPIQLLAEVAVSTGSSKRSQATPRHALCKLHEKAIQSRTYPTSPQFLNEFTA